MATEIPHITGLVPYQVEQAIQRLREAIDSHSTQLDRLAATQASQHVLTLPEIQQALSPTGAYPLPTAALLNTTSAPVGGTSPTTPLAPAPPDHLAEVQAVLAAMPLSGSSTPEEIFKFCQTVVWNIFNLGTDPPGFNVGLLMQPSGDGVYTCQGISYASFRLCYDNGANIKILTGSWTAQWTQEADVATSDWHAPTDPADPC